MHCISLCVSPPPGWHVAFLIALGGHVIIGCGGLFFFGGGRGKGDLDGIFSCSERERNRETQRERERQASKTELMDLIR